VTERVHLGSHRATDASGRRVLLKPYPLGLGGTHQDNIVGKGQLRGGLMLGSRHQHEVCNLGVWYVSLQIVLGQISLVAVIEAIKRLTHRGLSIASVL